MKICITGVSGYLGSALAQKLTKEGFCVVGLGSVEKRPPSLSNTVSYYSVDIRNGEALASILKEEQIDVVYHFAAIKYVGKCEADPELCFDINTGGTEAVLDAMHRAAVPHLVYASTYAVYDWSGDDVTLKEDTSRNPQTVYGESKKRSEDLIEAAFKNKYIKRYHILRYGNIIGGIHGVKVKSVQSFVDKLIFASRHDTSINIFSNQYHTEDGSVARDFVDVRDVVEANYLVLKNAQSGAFNIATGSTTTLLKLVYSVEQLTGKKISVQISSAPKPEPSSIRIDSRKAQTELLWFPQYSTEESIQNLNSLAEY